MVHGDSCKQSSADSEVGVPGTGSDAALQHSGGAHDQSGGHDAQQHAWKVFESDHPSLDKDGHVFLSESPDVTLD